MTLKDLDWDVIISFIKVNVEIKCNSGMPLGDAILETIQELNEIWKNKKQLEGANNGEM